MGQDVVFRDMRRTDRELTPRDAEDILCSGKFGILAISGVEGYPYAMPMNYVFYGEKLYFHVSVHDGLRSDSIEQDNRACFTVVEPLGGPRSRSVIVFGTLAYDDSLKEDVLGKIVDKYVPEPGREAAKTGIPHGMAGARCLVLTVDHMSAKIVDKPEKR